MRLGLATHLERFRPSGLMPKTEHYVTYEGSLTYPGCFETVTWIIMNSPIYTTLDNVFCSVLTFRFILCFS